MNILNLSVFKSNVEFFIESSIISSIAGFSALKIANFLERKINASAGLEYICNSGGLCCFASNGSRGFPFCPERIIGVQTLRPTFIYISNYVVKTRNYLIKSFEMPQGIFTIALNAILEEVLCRFIIQKAILREIPRSIASKISQDKAIMVDHYIAKIFRVAVSSIIFGLLHTQKWKYVNCGTIPEIAGGLIFGVLAETKFGLIGSCFAHTFANWL